MMQVGYHGTTVLAGVCEHGLVTNIKKGVSVSAAQHGCTGSAVTMMSGNVRPRREPVASSRTVEILKRPG